MKEMLINVSAGQERRLAIVAEGKLQELYVERESTDSQVGNIYKGRVTNIEPSIQAAFIDFGGVRNGFLHISDLQAQYFPKDKRIEEPVGRKASRKDRPAIQDCLKRGQEIVCQVIKSGIGTKGPTLTTYLSVPGRFLVMMPGMTRFGVSRKIEDEQQREEMRSLLEQIEPPADLGFIVRTAGLGHSKRDLQQDLKYLQRLWDSVTKRMKKGKAPLELYQESDLVIRTIRDVYSSEISKIICDRHQTAYRVADFLKVAMPRSKNKVEIYTGKHPLFDRYGIEEEIERIYSRRVEMPGGASLVIDQTEALVAIDVNSGKNRQNDNAEETAYKINQQAAREVARQLRLRDMGGVIVIDFIDMRMERHQRDIERILREEVKKDRAKTKILKISRFGLIEMTRQRMRPSLKRSLFSECPNCVGHGVIKSDESLGLSVIRSLQLACTDSRIEKINLSVPHRVAEYLNNSRRGQIARLENISEKQITINSDNTLAGDEVKIECLDQRSGIINWLPDPESKNPMPSAPADAPANMIGKKPSSSELVDVKKYDPQLHNPWQDDQPDVLPEKQDNDDDDHELGDNSYLQSDEDQTLQEDEKPNKKRRRRRKRKKKSTENDAAQQVNENAGQQQDNSREQGQEKAAEQSAPGEETTEADGDTAGDHQQNGDEAPKKKRRRRGGRRHRSKRQRDDHSENPQPDHPDLNIADKPDAPVKDADRRPAGTDAPVEPREPIEKPAEDKDSSGQTERSKSSRRRSRNHKRPRDEGKPVQMAEASTPSKVETEQPQPATQSGTKPDAPEKMVDAPAPRPAAKQPETDADKPDTTVKTVKKAKRKTAKKKAAKAAKKVIATESEKAEDTKTAKKKAAKKTAKKKTAKKKTAKKKTAKKKTAKKAVETTEAPEE